MAKFKFQETIFFEDDHFLAINKLPGMASLHERVPDGSSVIEHAKLHNPDLQLCHRLDKETSGILLLAKTEEAYRHASLQFQKRMVVKRYHAVCCGVHYFDNLEVNLPLVITRSGRSSVNSLKGKDSKTTLKSIEQFKHYTLIEATPHTGRLHQIRIHLGSQRAPIAMDEVYGGCIPKLSDIKKGFNFSKNQEDIKPMINRVVLHAYSLTFQNMGNKEVTLCAPYLKDMTVFMKLLKKYDT